IVQEIALKGLGPRGFKDFDDELPALPFLYLGTLETPLRFGVFRASLQFSIEYLEPPGAKILLKPKLGVGGQKINLEDAILFECSQPGLIYQDTYHRFEEHIKRTHLLNLSSIREMAIPEPLF